ncbi:helix-turn-helix transcriptional regulator [Achromobacter ruhlandii]|uniref:helix-turn-helix transcriptional regulator n=1 Tax=Achromobacter ruhlandii TaxID=72557 RepID=UPI0007BF9F98|nr:AraC family transcriptional regulator [Achromobacter ruhlandii]
MKTHPDMPRHAAPSTPPDLPTSSMFDTDFLAHFLPGQRHRLVYVQVAEGIELCHWQSAFEQPFTVHTRDDGDRVLLSYQLRGETDCWLEGGVAGQGDAIRETSGCLYYTPDRRGHFAQHGVCESLTVALRPDVLRTWIEDEEDAALRRSLDSGSCFRTGYRGEKLHRAALAISRELKHLRTPVCDTPGARLIREAQAMMLTGLFLEAGHADLRRANAAAPQRQRLMAARDYLLADLAHPPTLAQMAAETGLSAMRIKRGFRELFGHSVYGLFQQTRMREAQQRLRAGKVTVMEVAFDLGYSNPSHFAAAFRKEFGVGPGEYKRGLSLTPAGSTPSQSDAAPPSSSAP